MVKNNEPSSRRQGRLRFESFTNAPGRYALVKRTSDGGKSTLVIDHEDGGPVEVHFLDKADPPPPSLIESHVYQCPCCGAWFRLSAYDDGSTVLTSLSHNNQETP
jgi:hypothetical protein